MIVGADHRTRKGGLELMTRQFTMTALGLLSLLWPLYVASAADDFGALQRDVEILKDGQKEILKELQDLKNILRGPQPTFAAPVRPPSPGGGETTVVSIAGAPSKGEITAKVTLVEFSDYQCPFCARHARDSFPQIDRDYVQTGKVRYVLRDMPIESIHPLAFKAAEAVHCAAEQKKFWQMHQRIFANQNAVGRKDLTAHARALGLDIAAFDKCVDSAKHAGRIRRDMADAKNLGITGTPTFFVGLSDPTGAQVKAAQKIVGAVGYPTFSQAIEALLAAP